jgi:hypothetical protein
MNKIKILYFYRNIKQLSLSSDLPDVVVKEYIGNGHIVLDKTLLCRKNVVTVQKDLGADGRIFVTTVKRNINMCPECVDRWKKTLRGPWEKWTKMIGEK